MTKKLTRLEKSTVILKNACATMWCYVNTENEFTFVNQTFVISEEVGDYKVYQKAGTVDDYTNEAYMDSVLVAINSLNSLSFYNQNYDEIENSLVQVKK